MIVKSLLLYLIFVFAQDPNCVLTNLAGSNIGSSGYVDGFGTSALFTSLGGVAVDNNGTVFVSDIQGMRKLRRINSTGSVSSPTMPGQVIPWTVAMTQSAGRQLVVTTGWDMHTVYGTWVSTMVSFRICGNSWQILTPPPWSCVSDNAFYRPNSAVTPRNGGPVYVICQTGYIKVFGGIGAPFTGSVTPFVGGGPQTGTLPYTDGVGTNARIGGGVSGMAITDDGDTLYFADTHYIRRVATATAMVTTLAGCGQGMYAPGAGFSACFNFPSSWNMLGMLVTPRWGLLIPDWGNGCLRSLALDGTARTNVVAGQCGILGNTLGPATSALMNAPLSVAQVNGSAGTSIIITDASFSVKLLSCPTSLLFQKLPTVFEVMEDHCESISIPEGFELLASSDECINEAMQHKEKKIYGLQFHSEVSGNFGRVIIENFVNFAD